MHCDDWGPWRGEYQSQVSQKWWSCPCSGRGPYWDPLQCVENGPRFCTENLLGCGPHDFSFLPLSKTLMRSSSNLDKDLQRAVQLTVTLWSPRALPWRSTSPKGRGGGFAVPIFATVPRAVCNSHHVKVEPVSMVMGIWKDGRMEVGQDPEEGLWWEVLGDQPDAGVMKLVWWPFPFWGKFLLGTNHFSWSPDAVCPSVQREAAPGLPGTPTTWSRRDLAWIQQDPELPWWLQAMQLPWWQAICCHYHLVIDTLAAHSANRCEKFQEFLNPKSISSGWLSGLPGRPRNAWALSIASDGQWCYCSYFFNPCPWRGCGELAWCRFVNYEAFLYIRYSGWKILDVKSAVLLCNQIVNYELN
jgi:hypothetical protein